MSTLIETKEIMGDESHWKLLARMFGEFSDNHPESRQEARALFQQIEALFVFRNRLIKASSEPVKLDSFPEDSIQSP